MEDHTMDAPRPQEPQPSTSAGAGPGGPRPKTGILLGAPAPGGLPHAHLPSGTPILIKSTSGKQVLAYPIQSSPTGAGAGRPTLVAMQPKSEQTGAQAPAPLQLAVQGHFPPQIINYGDQKLLLTRTPNGPGLFPITTMSPQQRGGGGGGYATMAAAAALDPPLQSPTISSGSGSFAPLPGAGGSGPGYYPTTPGPAKPQPSSNRPTPCALATPSILCRKRAPPKVTFEPKRCRKSEPNKGVGLRHFSMRVCEKVREKGRTTYNEVADELVSEHGKTGSDLTSTLIQFDHKNIRRRVYDALNVLMAMKIISKENKEIKWHGMPTNSLKESTTLEAERAEQIKRIKKKYQELEDLIIQQVAYKSLVERNKEREKESGPPPPCSSVQLPFLICSTSNKTVIDASISQDKSEYLFNFNQNFELHDDIEVLKRMGMALGLDKNDCTEENIAKAKSFLPEGLAHYVDNIAKGTYDWETEFERLNLGTEPGHFKQNEEDVEGATGGGDDVQGATGGGEDDVQGATGGGEDDVQGATGGGDDVQGAFGGGEDDFDESMLESFGEAMGLTDDEDDEDEGFPSDWEVQAIIDALSAMEPKIN